MLPTTSLGNVNNTTQQMLHNSLENELKNNFKLISKEIFEKAQEQAFQELDFEECTEDQCILLIQEMLQVENAFQLEIVREEADTQLSLSLRTLDESLKQSEICSTCSTLKLNENLVNIYNKLLKRL